ncbi:MAG: peptidylprolyl isomerase [Leptolyngbyaceae cyanobacterium CSU_1_4]|nr:peptidylprolyl isomerase [Leptolyngbyaceae cyanobacterium CSU_1_4]
MSALKIGDRQLNSDQIVSALVQYKLLEPLVGQVLLDGAIEQVPLSEQELFSALGGDTHAEMPNLQEFVGQWCQQMEITPVYFKGVILRELRVQKFKQTYFANQIEAEFIRLKPEFDQVEFSLLQLADLSLAQELYFHLRDDGADFETLARQYGQGRPGGRLGPMAMAELPPEVANLFRGGQTTVCTPIKVGEFFWIVRLEKLIAARLTEAVRASLMTRLYDRWLNAQVNTLMSQPGAIQMQPSDQIQQSEPV